MRQDQFDEAIDDFQKALEVRPQLAIPHYNLGLELASRCQIDSAIPVYEKALELKYDYAEAHFYLAVSLAARGGPAEIGRCPLRKAFLTFKPEYAERTETNCPSWLAGAGRRPSPITARRRRSSRYEKKLSSRIWRGRFLLQGKLTWPSGSIAEGHGNQAQCQHGSKPGSCPVPAGATAGPLPAA